MGGVGGRGGSGFEAKVWGGLFGAKPSNPGTHPGNL